MGYTHYYSVSPKYDAELFEKVSIDFKKMIEPLNHLGVKLAGGNGEDTPVISPTEICFNGMLNCGHTERQLGITWPSKTAKGVSKGKVDTIISDIVNGSWFGGASLETRACGGDCSHEGFLLQQKLTDIPDWKQDDLKAGKLIFEFTKTAYKPYDLAVNVCLIIAKHYLKDKIKISSDGEMSNWEEGMQLCQHFLKYGANFKLDEGGE